MFNSFFNRGKVEDYKLVFSTPQGRRVLKDLLDFCHYNKPTYVVGDSYATHYNEGLRRVALRLTSFLNLDLQELNQLISEDE
jgi:hypothetical protein